MIRSLLYALLASVCFASVTLAQTSGLSTMGTDFWVPLLTSSDHCAALLPFRSASLYVTSYCDAKVTVSYFDPKTGAAAFDSTYSLHAMRGERLPLNVKQLTSTNNYGDVPEYRTCHVSSSDPVTVIAYSDGPVASYQSLILPTPLLGNRYVVATLEANAGAGAATACKADSSSSEFLVIASYDSTHVTITTTSNTLDGLHLAGQPFTLLLRRGQSLTEKSWKSLGVSLESSIVTSDKPVAVWGAQEAANYGGSRFSDPHEEMRNMIAQQLLPVRLWTRGPFYTLPLLDPPGLPATEPIGNELRYYGDDSTFTIDHSGGAPGVSIQPGGSSVVDNVTSPTFDLSLHNFMVEMVDYRSENKNTPVATPTMVNVLPWSSATTSMLLTVPKSLSATESNAYISVISGSNGVGNGYLDFWVDGVGPQNLDTFVIASYTIFGGFRGRIFKLTPGSTYAIASDVPLQVTQMYYGGVATSGALQHGSANSYFFSSAAPSSGRFLPIRSGQLGGGRVGYEHPVATATLNCDASWSIDAQGTDTAPLGMAVILRDPHGFYLSNGYESGYTSLNIGQTGPLITPGSTSQRIRIPIANPLQNADAWVQVVNIQGVDTLLHLHYTAPKLSQSQNDVSFDNAPIGLDSCVTVRYTNYGAAEHAVITINRLTHTDSTFIVTSSLPLPVTLQGDEYVDVTICHTAHVESRADTLHVVLDCGEARIPMHSISPATTMTANDYDFHGGVVGMTYNHRIALMNTGPANLLVSKIERTGSTAFTFTDSARFPVFLAPNASVELGFRYIPTAATHDTSYFTWISNASGTKTVSRVIGRGLKGGLVWRDSLVTMDTVAHRADTIWLHNPTGADGGVVYVNDARFSGPDAGDFRLTANQLGYYPLQSFPLAASDSVWFVVEFDPDLASTNSVRHARLVAYDNNLYEPAIELTGTIGASAVTEPIEQHTSLRPTLTAIEVQASESGAIELFDVLGRVITSSGVPRGNSTVTISTLPTGTYIARFVSSSGKTHTSIRFVR